MSVLSELELPIVQAPMAGGPSTPALAVAVDRAGGLGMLAAGYLGAERLAADIVAVRSQTPRFGLNVFVGGGAPADVETVRGYAERLRADAERAGVQLGTPRFDDDSFAEKVALLVRERVPVVSFTFGLPPADVIARLRDGGAEVWLTVTSPEEALAAVAVGADALIVQGVESGGHRGVFVDDESQSDLTLLAALQLVRAAVDLPLVAAGAIMTGAALAAVLAAGASAGQLGSAYLRSVEAGTSEAQREATATDTATVLTRAFSGRTARGIRNRLHDEHAAAAPSAYPEVHHLTSPLRGHARKVGDADLINLWAGQAHVLAAALPAEEITRRIAAEAREALERARF
ncbi:MAG TPA: nitronate monooxygenase [Solirubrobacteraceae bacterium]|nr:nitronate monooxygenase [Solirubrobacteraceae bacterium]